MNTVFTYLTSNTDNQTVDTFDLGSTASIRYDVQVTTNTDISDSTILVNHNGVTTGESQHGSSHSGNTPLLFTTDISNYVGRLRCQPSTSNTIIRVVKQVVETTNYGETTVSGRLIRAASGFALDYQAALTSATVRQANNDQYKSPTIFVVANTLGPIDSKDELLNNNTFEDNSYWVPFNDSQLTVNANVGSIESLNTIDNYYYQQIPTTPGKVYRVSGDGFSTAGGSVRVGNSVELPYAVYALANTSQPFELFFTPDNENTFVSFGHIDASGITVLSNVSCKESAPFHTFDPFEGTYYVKWSAVAAGNTILTLQSANTYQRVVAVSVGNNVTITENTSVNIIGSQSTTNKLVFNHSNNTFRASLNGNAIVEFNVSDTVENINSMVFSGLPLQFSYTPYILSNTTMIEMSTNV